MFFFSYGLGSLHCAVSLICVCVGGRGVVFSKENTVMANQEPVDKMAAVSA